MLSFGWILDGGEQICEMGARPISNCGVVVAIAAAGTPARLRASATIVPDRSLPE